MDAEVMTSKLPMLTKEMHDHFVKCLENDGYRVFAVEKVRKLTANSAIHIQYVETMKTDEFERYMHSQHAGMIAGELCKAIAPKFVRQINDSSLEFRTEVMMVLE